MDNRENNLLQEFLKENKGARFVSIKNYSNNNGDKSNYLIICNFSYENAKEKDIKKLNKIKYPNILMEEARVELLNSLINNSSKDTTSNQSKAQKEVYRNISECVKIHIESGKLFIFGKVVRKDVIEKAEYKEVKSSDLTIAKNKIRKKLHHTKYRQFSVDKIKSCRLNGKEFIIEL